MYAFVRFYYSIVRLRVYVILLTVGWYSVACMQAKSTYVTGYWKTDHNVTLGRLHFIGPANGHTHPLSMHHYIIGLS